MNEEDKQAVEAARGLWPDDKVVQELVAIIDRLDDERIKQHDTIMNYSDEVGFLKGQLTEVREVGEPFRVFYELTLSRLPDISWVVRKGRIETGDFRRLTQTLGKIEG